jgi:hypothetical protein
MVVDQHVDRGRTAAEMNDPKADVVSRQYQKYRYPGPIQDLEGLAAEQLAVVRSQSRTSGVLA